MAVGQIPPWIKPADEADYLGRGLQIGASMAAQQAQEEYRNQQLMLEQAQAARQAQQDAIAQQQAQARQALLEKQFQIEAKQAAAKSQALLGYQQAIQEGKDPLQAILQYGPGMGQPVTSAAAAQRAILAEQNKVHAPPFAPAAVQAFPVLDPDTKEPIPGFIATPSPTGKGMTIHLTKPPAEISPSAAANMLARLPELEGASPGITTNLAPILTKRVTEAAKPLTAKATQQVLPMPAKKEDAVVGSVYMTKVGPRRWDGDHFVPVKRRQIAEGEPDAGDEE